MKKIFHLFASDIDLVGGTPSQGFKDYIGSYEDIDTAKTACRPSIWKNLQIACTHDDGSLELLWEAIYQDSLWRWTEV